jgi:hypothetical protein
VVTAPCQYDNNEQSTDDEFDNRLLIVRFFPKFTVVDYSDVLKYKI